MLEPAKKSEDFIQVLY